MVDLGINNTLDEGSIVTETHLINKDNLPTGLWWQEDGACFKAELCDIDPADNGWRWVPKNAQAMAMGKPNAKMNDFIMPDFSCKHCGESKGAHAFENSCLLGKDE